MSNDILRLWRTFCVNYEANTRTDPPEKKAKRKLKNYKLKHSRLLTCYSALAYLLGVYTTRNTVTPLDAREMVHMRPTERLEYLLQQKEFEPGHAKVNELMTCYERFLEKTNVEEKKLGEQFLEPDGSKALFVQINQFGDLVSELLYLIGSKSRLYRLLVV